MPFRSGAVARLALLVMLALAAVPKAHALQYYNEQGYAFQNCQREMANSIRAYAAWQGEILIACVLEPVTGYYDGHYRLQTKHYGGLWWTYWTHDFSFIIPGASSAKPEENVGCPAQNGVSTGTGGCGDTQPIIAAGGSAPAFDIGYGSRGVGLATTPNSGSLGLNRTHTYQRSVVTAAMLSPTTGQPETWAYVTRSDGSVDRYVQTGASWVGSVANKSLLVALTGAQGQVIGWQRRGADGTLETFGASGLLESIVERSGLVTTLAYDANNHLESVTDARGRSLIFTHNSFDQISRIDLPDGRFVTLTYADGMRMSSITFPDQTTREYKYQETGYFTATSDTRVEDTLTGIYDEAGVRLSSTYYDANVRVSRRVLAGGVADYQYAYVESGDQSYSQTTTVATPLGATLTFGQAVFAGRIRTISESKSCPGCTTVLATRSYDSAGYPNVSTDFEGAITDLDFDANGLLTQMVSADSATIEQTTSTQWDTALRVPTQIDRAGQRLNYTYNARGQVTLAKVTDLATSVVRTTSAAYCEQAQVDSGACPLIGLLTSVNGPRLDVSDLTLYTYRQSDHGGCAANPTTCAYRKGDLWKVTNAAGQVTEFVSRDGAGRLTSVKDPAGVITDFVYSPRGLLTHTKVRGADAGTEADDAVTRIDYTATGLVDRVTQPDATYVNFTYDAAHRLTDVTDALGHVIHYTLDAAGNRLLDETKDSALPNATVRQQIGRIFDALGQMKSLVDATGVTDLAYDDNGQMVLVTDALGRQASTEIDALGRVSQAIANATGTGVEKATTGFVYDGRNNLTQVTDPKSLATTYTYNGFDDLTQLASPDTGTATYSYDGAGNRVSETNARAITTGYSFDVLNRLTGINLPTETDIAFVYDTPEADCLTSESFGAGQLAKITDSSGSTRYCYDRQGRVVRKVQTVIGGTTLTTGTTYDGAGNLIAMTYPSGAIVTYLRNANGQITQVDAKPTAIAAQVTIVDDVTYAPFGPITSVTYGNGRKQSRTYDQNYSIDEITETEGTGGFTANYTLDAIGNVTSITERGTLARDFTYDGQDRLKAMTNGGSNVESFTYDSTGNRKTKTLAAAASNYTYATYPAYPTTSHRLVNVSNQGTRIYDAAGNTTLVNTGAPAIYGYDERGRMRTVTLNATLQRTYKYNGKGERVLRIVEAGTSQSLQFVYDEAGHLLGEYTTGGTRVAEYVWMGDTLVGVLRSHDGSTYQFVETDHLGTPRSVINPLTNAVIWRWDLTTTTFGDHLPANDPDGNAIVYGFNLRYPGQYYDGLEYVYYNYYRDYDSRTGRYLQSDPTGLDGGISTFAYVGSDPLSYSDPTGEQRGPRRSAPVDPWSRPYGPRPLQTIPITTQPRSYVPDGPSSCSACLEIIYVAPVRGTSRSGHRSSANDYLIRELESSPRFNASLSKALGVPNLLAQMRSGRGRPVNPQGTEWHHQPGTHGVVWLLRRCDHRDPALQDFLHSLPGRRGGFGAYRGE